MECKVTDKHFIQFYLNIIKIIILPFHKYDKHQNQNITPCTIIHPKDLIE